MSACLARGEGFSAEVLNYGRDGRKYWLAIEVQPIHDEQGGLTNFMAIESDIISRERAGRELRSDRDALAKAKEVAESANRAKSVFLAMMSHEIRTPINGIMGMLDLTLDATLPDELREQLTMARSAADSLRAILDDTLDFSKIEVGKLQLERAPFCLKATAGNKAEAARRLGISEKSIYNKIKRLGLSGSTVSSPE